MNIEKKLLPINPMSRCGQKQKKIQRILIHETKQRGQSIHKEWEYFNSLTYQDDQYDSVHYLIDRDGSCIACVPEDEVTWSTLLYEIDETSISIACSAIDKEGTFGIETMQTLSSLLDTLCLRYNLDRKIDVMRHYDITGTRCPTYLVDNEIVYQTLTKKDREA